MQKPGKILSFALTVTDVILIIGLFAAILVGIISSAVFLAKVFLYANSNDFCSSSNAQFGLSWTPRLAASIKNRFESIYDFYNIPQTEKHIALPSSRHFATCKEGPGEYEVFCFGGIGLGEKEVTMLNDAWIWNTLTYEWQEVEITFSPSPRLHPNVWVLGGEVYLGGGYLQNGIVLADFYKLDRGRSTWQELKNHSFPSVYQSKSWVDGGGKMILFGEETLFNQFTSFFYFQPNSYYKEWKRVSLTESLPIRRSYNVIPISYAFGSFYLFGGTLLNKDCTTEVWMYEHNVGWALLSNTSRLSNFKTAPLFPGCFQQANVFQHPRHQSLVYVMGEGDRNDIWTFNTWHKTWHWTAGFPKAFPLAFQRDNFMYLPPLNGSAVFKDYNNNIYMFGGSAVNNSVYYNLVWQLNKDLI
jgi:hypothetical protein